MSEPNPIERADIAAAEKLAPHRDEPVVKALGRFGKLGDQPPLFALGLATLGVGLVLQRRPVIEAGLRVLAAEGLATAVKSVVKKRVARTRPHKMLDEGEYRAEAGEPEGKGEQSFPSGHTAGAVAVAGVLSAFYPPATVPLYAAAATISLIQAPTAKHYPSDIAAGAAIGGVSALAVHLAFSRLWPPRPSRLRDRAGQAALARWRQIAG